MGYDRREDFDGARHHVMNAICNGKEARFDDQDRAFFMELLSESSERFSLDVELYCLMGTHFHLVVHTPKGQLSDGLQYLSSVFAKRFNWKNGMNGALFRRRFLSKLVHDDDYFMELVRYVHRNPEDLGARPATYRWSSYKDYLGIARPPGWLRTQAVQALFGGDICALRRFVDEDRPGQVSVIVPNPALDAVERAVTDRFDLDPATLFTTKRGERNLGRSLVVLLAVESSCAPPAEIAQRYGFRSTSSLRSSVTRTRALLEADDALASEVGTLDL